MDHIEVFKSGDFEQPRTRSGDGYVYNIEVEGLHTYVAEGVVVHNCHHVQETNKWGKAAALFPNALGLGVTATPCRADGKGLGRGHGGVFEQMVEGPQMRWLIEQGFLTDYDVAHFQSDVNYAEVGLSAGGDLSPRAHAAAVHKSARIVGDVVRHYQRLAAGKRGITFAVDVEEAEKLANAYKAADVPAAVIHGKMRDSERTKIMRLFRSGQILQLCNCDILGEGVDVPAVEVVSMARKTMSYSLFAQQFGRMLRPFEGKARGLLIDHVGNFNHHKPPDRRRIWSLDGEVRMQAPKDGVAMRTCAMCGVPYEAFFPSCPNCGHEPLPVERRTPQQVDGDLTLLDADVLAAMRAEYDEIDRAARVPYGATQMIIDHLKNVKWEKQEAQKSLRDAIARWGGARTIEGLDVRTAQRRFFHELGIDILSAQALGPREAAELEKRVKAAW